MHPKQGVREDHMKIVAAILGAASLLTFASGSAGAQEIRAQPLGLATHVDATNVAFGCGPGFFPNRFGVCRPRFIGGYGYGYGRPYGYGYGGYGRGYYGGYGYRRFGYY